MIYIIFYYYGTILSFYKHIISSHSISWHHQKIHFIKKQRWRIQFLSFFFFVFIHDLNLMLALFMLNNLFLQWNSFLAIFLLFITFLITWNATFHVAKRYENYPKFIKVFIKLSQIVIALHPAILFGLLLQ